MDADVLIGRAALAVLAVGAFVAVAAGCDSHETARGVNSTGPPPPSVADDCGGTSGVSVGAVWLRASDGQRLYAIRGGGGDVGVLLVPESPPGNVCGWFPSFAAFERAGLRVLAVDYRGTGNSPLTSGHRKFAYGLDLAAAVSRLRQDGAKVVVVVGASLGAAAAIAFGPQLGIDGVVSLSGEPALAEYHIDAAAALPRLRVPLLIVGARDDPYLPVAAARRLLRRAAARNKRLAFFPGSWHGWDIINAAPFSAKARALVISWIRKIGRKG